MTMRPAKFFESQVRRSLWRSVLGCLLILALVLPDASVLAATERHGQVTFGGLPVPGATVTAAMGDKSFTAITDPQGAYSFADLDDGVWMFKVEMRGFATQTEEITLAADTPPPMWELKLLPLAEITRGITITTQPAASTPTAPATPAAKQQGFQRATANRPATRRRHRLLHRRLATQARTTSDASTDERAATVSSSTAASITARRRRSRKSLRSETIARGRVALQRRRRRDFRHVVVGRRAVFGDRVFDVQAVL